MFLVFNKIIESKLILTWRWEQERGAFKSIQFTESAIIHLNIDSR